MNTFENWFKKNITVGIILLLLTAIFLLTFFWINSELNKANILDRKIDKVTNRIEQSIQKHDRPQLESLASSSITDLPAKSLLICSDKEILYSLSNKVILCENIKEESSIITKIYERTLASSPHTKLFIITSRYAFIKEVATALIIILIYISLFIFYLVSLNKKIKREILSPLSYVKDNASTNIIEIQEILYQRKKAISLELKEKLIEVSQKQARQLSHDIRSPLAALKVVKEIGTSSMDPEVAKILSMSIDRITDIANTILPKKSEQDSGGLSKESSFIWMLIDQIISEKRVEYKKVSDVSIQFQVEGSPFELNALCNPAHFMRSISNIVNNSIEARVENHPIQIALHLSHTPTHVLLSIQDNGKGISPEMLPKVFDESFSHGKKQGTGLGLFQVKQAVESWGGSIQIESQVNVGTKLTIQLKKSPKPKWLADSILTSSYQSMIILDDEEYVSSILKDRFSEYFKDIRYFKVIEEFETHIAAASGYFVFMDHDLKQSLTGIDLIQKHRLQSRSVLLTGNYDDKQVQQKALELGIKILPKPLINDIPVIS